LPGVPASKRDLRYFSYDIIRDPLPDLADPGIARIDDAQRDEVFQLIHDDPVPAIAKLEKWVQQHPESRLLRNWLAMAYCSAGDNEKAESEARALYERHPDYLFAKVTMAQFALQRGDLSEVERIFEKKYDLKLLYPDRNVFHISEFLGLARVMVEYWLRKGELRAAELYFDAMAEMEPHHPLTEQAGAVMEGALLLEMARTMLPPDLAAGSERKLAAAMEALLGRQTAR
jgi:hypothetical protein